MADLISMAERIRMAANVLMNPQSINPTIDAMDAATAERDQARRERDARPDITVAIHQQLLRDLAAAQEEINNIALRAACYDGDETEVQRLLQAGANMLFIPNGRQILDDHIVPYAYELGAKSNTHWKRMFAEEEARRERVGRGFRDVNGGTFLHTASYRYAETGDEGMVQSLFRVGVSLDIRDRFDHLASDMGHPDRLPRLREMFAEERVRRQHLTTAMVNQFDAAILYGVPRQAEQQAQRTTTAHVEQQARQPAPAP